MDKSQSVTLFQLGGDDPWSDPITVNPDHVSSVEPYKRVGKPPTVPRCAVSMLNGTTYRILGESDHVLEWLGWDTCPAADAYKKFVALRKPSGAPEPAAVIPEPVAVVPEPTVVPKPVVAPESATGRGSEPAAGDIPEPAAGDIPEPAAGDIPKPAAGGPVPSGIDGL